MNLRSHVDVTVTVLEYFKDIWGKYFDIEDFEKFVEEIHLAADVIVKDFVHHFRGKHFREKLFYHIMKARHIWLGIVDGYEDPKSPRTVTTFFENLILAMHLLQDAVISARDMREHDFIEKKIWELLKRYKVVLNVNAMPLQTCRAKLKSLGFTSDVTCFVDPEDACYEAAVWSAYVAKAVMSERVIPKEEAERFLIKNGVVRVVESKNENLGRPIRDRIAKRRREISENMNLGIKLALLHLFIVFICGMGYGYYYYKGYYNPIVEAWLTPIQLWVGLPVGLFILKKILLRRYDMRSVKELKKAELLDYYPSHAFFDAPDVYLEYIEGSPVKKPANEIKISSRPETTS